MPIKLVQNRSLFDSEAQTLVNTVNCVGAMGKGIAKEYRKRFPEMYQRYVELCNRGLIRPGKLWLFKTDEKWILNFPTKDHWRDKSEIIYLEKGLEKFMSTYKMKGIESIAFPLLGSNNGGISSERSLNLMIKYLSNCSISVQIFVDKEKQ